MDKSKVPRFSWPTVHMLQATEKAKLFQSFNVNTLLWALKRHKTLTEKVHQYYVSQYYVSRQLINHSAAQFSLI